MKWAPSKHRWSSKSGIRKDHGLLEMRMRLRLPKVERVHGHDQRYWKTDDGSAAVKLAVLASIDNYDKGQLAPNEIASTASTTRTTNSTFDL